MLAPRVQDPDSLLDRDYESLSLHDRCEALRLAREAAILDDERYDLAWSLPAGDPRREAYVTQKRGA